MIPRKELVEMAVNSGAIDKAALMLALAYITISAGNNFMEESNDYIQRYGVVVGELKKAHNDFVKSADRYFRICSDMFSKECSVTDYFNDLDKLEKRIRAWADIETKIKEIEEKRCKK